MEIFGFHIATNQEVATIAFIASIVTVTPALFFIVKFIFSGVIFLWKAIDDFKFHKKIYKAQPPPQKFFGGVYPMPTLDIQNIIEASKTKEQ